MSAISVLLIENNAADAALVRHQLAADTRFRVEHSGSLEDALRHLRNDSTTDVVLLDLNLPDSTGLATFLTLQAHFPDTAIVILSGHQDEALAIESVQLGAQDFLSKHDADTKTLRRSLMYALERRGRMAAEQRIANTERDFETARQIQQHILPPTLPEIPGFEIAGRCLPAAATAGDYFDCIHHDAQGKWDLLVADVSSHGFAPALIMAGIRRMLRTLSQQHVDLGEILTVTNRAVCEDTLEQQFMTMFYSRLDPVARSFTYASAGHLAYLLKADGQVEKLHSEGIPLGILAEHVYEQQRTVPLEDGDCLLLMTDSAWESRGVEGACYGHEAVVQLIDRHRNAAAHEIVDHLLEDVRRFSRSDVPEDDITVLLIKTLPEPPAAKLARSSVSRFFRRWSRIEQRGPSVSLNRTPPPNGRP